jgi:hypothetical protein
VVFVFVVNVCCSAAIAYYKTNSYDCLFSFFINVCYDKVLLKRMRNASL